LTYSSFKKEVMRRCGGVCENPHCDATAETVHHFLKQSTWPEYAVDPDNGMGSCGLCHSEIERRIRQGGNFIELYPVGRLEIMQEKVSNMKNLYRRLK